SHCSGGQSGSMTPHSAAAQSAPSCHASAFTVASHLRNALRLLCTCAPYPIGLAYSYSGSCENPSSTCCVVGVYWSLIVGLLCFVCDEAVEVPACFLQVLESVVFAASTTHVFDDRPLHKSEVLRDINNLGPVRELV